MLDFGAVDRLPDGLPPIFGKLLRIMHDPAPDIAEVERVLRADNFLRPGISVDLEALRAFLAPLAEPSAVETFKFSREWMREQAGRATDMSTSGITRKFNLPPSYVLIHRVSTAGIGVLCQLECEGRSAPRWCAGFPATRRQARRPRRRGLCGACRRQPQGLDHNHRWGRRAFLRRPHRGGYRGPRRPPVIGGCRGVVPPQTTEC